MSWSAVATLSLNMRYFIQRLTREDNIFISVRDVCISGRHVKVTKHETKFILCKWSINFQLYICEERRCDCDYKMSDLSDYHHRGWKKVYRV